MLSSRLAMFKPHVCNHPKCLDGGVYCLLEGTIWWVPVGYITKPDFDSYW